MSWLHSHGTLYQYKKQKDQIPTCSFAKIHNKHVQFQIFHSNSNSDYLLPRINTRASHEVFRKSFSCQMTYKIRPGHKQLTSKNKFCKACIWKKRCRARPHLYRARVTKQGMNHYSYRRGGMLNETKKVLYLPVSLDS